MKKQLGAFFTQILGRRDFSPLRRPQAVRRRLDVERLEDRVTPANASGTLTGVAFLDANQNGARDAGESLLGGIAINLVGTTNQGTPVSVSTSTDTNGVFTFDNLLPGAYQFATNNSFLLPGSDLSGSTGERVVSAIVINGGETLAIDAAFRGYDPSVISVRSFLNTASSQETPWGDPGAGAVNANYRANNAPTRNGVSGVFEIGANDTNFPIDLAALFTDPDMTNSEIRFDTVLGSLKVELYDTATPQTVANFFNYITSDRFDSTIFHRLEAGFVLQGGGFEFSSNPSQLTAVDTDAPVANEFDVSRSNLFGTIAVAKQAGNPNSGTSQFFFNLGNNSANLDSQNGGFTVFGKIVDAVDTLVLNNLAALPTQNQSGGDPNGVFAKMPLRNYTGTNFPTDTTAANYAFINDVAVTRRDEFLSYSVVNNSNSGLFSVAIENNRLLVTTIGGAAGTGDVTIRATDRYGISVESTITLNVNNRPTVEVELDADTYATNAIATATATRADLDGDDITLTYVWRVDGVVKRTQITTDTTDNFNLSIAGNGDAGQTITVEVIPNDGKLSGTSAIATADVVNTPPSISTINLTPADPTTETTLTAAVTAIDVDGGDSISFTYEWQVDGVVKQTTTTTATSDQFDLDVDGNGDVGQIVSVTVTPNDGSASGAPSDASVLIVNAAPTISSVTVTPGSPTTADNLTAVVVASDADNDAITYSYTWLFGGTILQQTDDAGNSDELLAATLAGLSSGDFVGLSVVASDGLLTSAAFFTSVQIA